jgi:hypothetical protein
MRTSVFTSAPSATTTVSHQHWRVNEDWRGDVGRGQREIDYFNRRTQADGDEQGG